MSHFPKHLSRLILAAVLLNHSALGDEAGANEVLTTYKAQVAAWTQEVEQAKTAAERLALWERQPDRNEFGEKLLRELDSSWDQEWILDFAVPLFSLAPGYATTPLNGPGTRSPLSALREAAERFHLDSSKLGPFALAITVDNGPKTRAFLEKIEQGHPDKTVQGQAAMALAIISRQLGDGGNVPAFKRRRMELVEKAVKESGHLAVGETTMAKIVKDFLFAITHLDKGMEAPDLLGRDVSGEAMRLSDYRGSPVMIVFWHAGMESAQDTADFLKKIEASLVPRGLKVLGVARESSQSLRQLVKDGEVTWPNWVDDSGKMAELYQIERYPSALVLDSKGMIQYNGVPGAFAELTAQALLK